MGRFETQLVYDVYDLHKQEYLRTFSTMGQVMSYCESKHKEVFDEVNAEEYEIKTVVRLYWVED